jgi:outer membrane protein assembly factor BamE (lipoprotein component of BamABCDE complex)
MRNKKWLGRGVLLTALLFCFLAGCAAQKVTTGAFTKIDSLDNLKRGVTTKMDVQRVLGAPNGFGGAILPTDPEPREVWYYEDIEGTEFKKEGEIMRMKMRQQILLIFFERGVFDGYMWTTNAGKADVRQ